MQFGRGRRGREAVLVRILAALAHSGELLEANLNLLALAQLGLLRDGDSSAPVLALPRFLLLLAHSSDSRNLSASIAAIHPVPAAVTAWR